MFLIRNSLRNVRKITQLGIVTAEINERNIHRWVAPTLRELKRRREKIGPEKPSPRSTFLEWNYEAEIYAFSRRLGENFNRDILKTALVQRSYVNMKNQESDSHNLKDNVDLVEEGSDIINQYLKNKFSNLYIEEIADSYVAYLTSDEMLSHVAKHLGLTDLILASEFPIEKNTLSNTFKAVVAALKQSDSVDRSQLFIEDFLVVQLNGKTVYDIWEPDDPLRYLNNLLEQKGMDQLEARLCNESASNTILATYQIGLYSNKKLLGLGYGENIELAKHSAALNAIQKIYNFV